MIDLERQDLIRHAYLHVEAQTEIRSMALAGAGGLPLIRAVVCHLAEGGYLTDPAGQRSIRFYRGYYDTARNELRKLNYAMIRKNRAAERARADRALLLWLYAEGTWNWCRVLVTSAAALARIDDALTWLDDPGDLDAAGQLVKVRAALEGAGEQS